LCIKEADINNIDVCFFYNEYRFVLGAKKNPLVISQGEEMNIKNKTINKE